VSAKNESIMANLAVAQAEDEIEYSKLNSFAKLTYTADTNNYAKDENGEYIKDDYGNYVYAASKYS
jgi:hypothetical protein